MITELITASTRIDAFERLLAEHGLAVSQTETFALYFACRARADGLSAITVDHLIGWARDGRAILDQKPSDYLRVFAEQLAMVGRELPATETPPQAAVAYSGLRGAVG